MAYYTRGRQNGTRAGGKDMIQNMLHNSSVVFFVNKHTNTKKDKEHGLLIWIIKMRFYLVWYKIEIKCNINSILPIAVFAWVFFSKEIFGRMSIFIHSPSHPEEDWWGKDKCGPGSCDLHARGCDSRAALSNAGTGGPDLDQPSNTCPTSTLKGEHGTPKEPRTTTNVVWKFITCRMKS